MKRVLLFGLFLITCVYTSASAQTVEQVPVPPDLASTPDCYNREVRVLVVTYLPTPDGVNLDAEITGVTATLDEMKSRIHRFSRQTKFSLEEGSKWHGYKNPASNPYLGYKVVGYYYVYGDFEQGTEVPWNPGWYRPNYHDVLEKVDGETFVNEKGVDEVWLWGWHHGTTEPAESNMASPVTGDVSNSERNATDLPIYDHTYVLYNYNFGRTSNQSVHNHGHQIEAQLRHLIQESEGSTTFYNDEIVGNGGRLGDTHRPSNTTEHYDYFNQTQAQSDIANWRPGGGPTALVNASTWGDVNYPWPLGDIPDGPEEANWYIYWMQSFPGNGNAIPDGDRYMSNWWPLLADWDNTSMAGLGVHADQPVPFEACSATPLGVRLFARVNLMGAYQTGGMQTGLAIPTDQPFSGAPWNYDGTESLVDIPDNAVDWVLLSAFAGDSAAANGQRAALLLDDGTLWDSRGTAGAFFPALAEGRYRIEIRHRNHLGVTAYGIAYMD